ncbi:MAG: hypothetical protein M3022_03940 [Actinomycetota bacterium]|nr:hypothetical protein [Actinomycetota bacterium]
MRHDSRVATVTKRSLVEALEAKREGGATRLSRQASQPSPDLAAALEAIERLTDALTNERRQLIAAAEARRQAAREREEARMWGRRQLGSALRARAPRCSQALILKPGIPPDGIVIEWRSSFLARPLGASVSGTER